MCEETDCPRIGAYQTCLSVQLAVPEGDPAFGEIVRRQLQGHLVAREDADAIPAQAAGGVGEDDTIVFQFNAEETAGEFFENRAGYFDAVFFAHRPPRGWGPGRQRLAAGRSVD